MKWKLIPRMAFPLLAKDLIEQSARRRTYVIRTIFAAALFVAFYLQYRTFARFQSPETILGTGSQLFRRVYSILIYTIYLLTPVLTCNAIAGEKERDSLGLLFLTRLSPREIIMEKYLSRVIPMLVFLLLCLPLMALAYSMGGLEARDIFFSANYLLFRLLLVAAIGIYCSAYCRTSVAALVHAYIIVAILTRIFSPYFTMAVLTKINVLYFLMRYLSIDPAYAYVVPVSVGIWHCVMIVPLLLLARRHLVRRAFLPPRNRMLEFFRKLDKLFNSINPGGIVLIKDRERPLRDKPVYWRESCKRSLGKLHYLVRAIVYLEVPAVLVGIATIGSHGSGRALTVLIYTVWIFAAITMTALAANSVPSERADQTLEVLMTTELSAKQIIKEKVSALRRPMLLFFVPFLTLFLFKGFSQPDTAENHWRLAVYLAASVGCVAIFLPLTAWVGMFFGMLFKNRMRAILGGLLAVTGWCVLPLWLFSYCSRFIPLPSGFGLLPLASPTTLVMIAERGVFKMDLFFAIIMSYLGIFFLLRGFCLHNAEKMLWRKPRTARLKTLPEVAVEAQTQ